MNKIDKLKIFLQENYPNEQAFNTRNLIGDNMRTVYDEDGIIVDYCYEYEYIEIFGLTDVEFENLIDDYGMLKNFNDEMMEENSIKNERSSIEENIEILEKFKNNKIQRDKLERDFRCGGWKIGNIYKCLELDNAIDNILSDYKRVLKENEILKEEKEQAWEEWNNLERGSYETEQKLKQQIKESQRENEELKERIREHTLLISPYYVKENYIPIQKIKDIIDRIDYDIKKTKEIILKNTNIYASYRKNDYQIVRLKAMNTKSLDIRKRLQELLESEE